MDQFRDALAVLAQAVCERFSGIEIPTRNTWTVVAEPTPHVALDVDRPAMGDLRFQLDLWLLGMQEYLATADAVETTPELAPGIVIDMAGTLHQPERTNLTRAFVTNFLWRFLQEGAQLDWDEARFDDAFQELERTVSERSIVVHTTMPLSNIKAEVVDFSFGDDLTLSPASIQELEQWINRNNFLSPLGEGPPQWDASHVDNPAVLRSRRTVIGRPRDPNKLPEIEHLPNGIIDQAVLSLRLALDAPIAISFTQTDVEGLMAFGGTGTSWSGAVGSPRGRFAVLDASRADEVAHIWQRLEESPNTDLLRLPLRRWSASLHRSSLEDRLIDTWIGLEALLLNGSQGELTYRAALRLAELLGASGNDRKRIYTEAKHSYAWRSAIVHGLKTNKLSARQSLHQTVSASSGWLRSALLNILELTTLFDPEKFELRLLQRDSN